MCFWTVDEFAELLIPFAWGILAQHIFLGIALAFAAWFVLRKAQSGNAGSALVHAADWYLPGGFLGLKATPPSHCRLLAGCGGNARRADFPSEEAQKYLHHRKPRAGVAGAH